MKIKPNFARHFEEFSKVEDELFTSPVRRELLQDVTNTLDKEPGENGPLDPILDAAIARGYACGLHAGVRVQREVATVLYAVFEEFQNYVENNPPANEAARLALIRTLEGFIERLTDIDENHSLLDSSI